MKKRLLGIIMVALFLVATLVGGGIKLAWTAATEDDAITIGGRPWYDIYDEDGMQSESEIGLATQQSIRRYVDSGGTVVYIDNINDLSAWDISNSGNSYFNTVGGGVYVVDMDAIARSAGTGTTTTAIVDMSGISAILPVANADSHNRTVTIIRVDTSSATALQVWPAASEGTTTYGTSGGTVQNMQATYAKGTSTTVIADSYDESMKYSGDIRIWRLYHTGTRADILAGTSAYLVGGSERYPGLHVSGSLSGTTTTGFTITGPQQGNVFMIDSSNTVQVYTGQGCYTTLGVGVNAGGSGGVTVVLPTVTKALDGWEVTIGKKEESGLASGTTEIVPYGTAVGTESGTTPGDANSLIILDNVGDTVTLVAHYDAGVSWFIKGYICN